MKRSNFELLILTILTIVFIACLGYMCSAQSILNDSVALDYIYKTNRPSLLINKTQTILSSDFVDVVLEPIPGKVTRWKISREEVLPDSIVTTFDDAETDGIYKGTWVAAVNNTLPFFNKTFHYSFVTGSYIEFNFNGRTIEWWSERNSSHGRVAIYIDGGIEEIINVSNLGPDIVRGKPSYSARLQVNGPHTIRIRVLDSKSVLHDFFRVIK